MRQPSAIPRLTPVGRVSVAGHKWGRSSVAPGALAPKMESIPVVVGAEEEVRKEQEREAALLKARSKLAEQAPAGMELTFLGPS